MGFVLFALVIVAIAASQSGQSIFGAGGTSTGSNVFAQGAGSTTAVDTGSDQEILARTIYGEARGEGTQGMTAVACVVMNRVNDTLHFPDGVLGAGAICQQSAVVNGRTVYQFSCWQPGTADYNSMMAVTTANATFAQCMSIAGQALAGSLADITNGAEFYYAPAGMSGGAAPSWAKNLQYKGTIGSQRFYGYA